MYFVIHKLEAKQLARLDLIMNFGVQMDIRSLILDMLHTGGNYEACAGTFKNLPFM